VGIVRDQKYEVAVEVHDATFHILDKLNYLDGDTVGAIAKAVQDVVEVELRRVI